MTANVNNNKDQQKTDQLTHIITVISATNNGIFQPFVPFKLDEQHETLSFTSTLKTCRYCSYFCLKIIYYHISAGDCEASVSRPARAKLPQSFYTLASSLANLPLISLLRHSIHQNVQTTQRCLS